MTMRDRLAVGLIGAGALFGALPAAAQDVAPITILINESPWFQGFAGLSD